jgi:toxin ParE1/3/4
LKRRPVFWSAEALGEIDTAIACLAARNPTAAKAVVTDLRDAGNRLGRAATGRPGRVLGTYEKSVTGRPYLIAYAIDTSPDGGDRIVILRVIHTARNWPSGRWPP